MAARCPLLEVSVRSSFRPPVADCSARHQRKPNNFPGVVKSRNGDRQIRTSRTAAPVAQPWRRDLRNLTPDQLLSADRHSRWRLIVRRRHQRLIVQFPRRCRAFLHRRRGSSRLAIAQGCRAIAAAIGKLNGCSSSSGDFVDHAGARPGCSSVGASMPPVMTLRTILIATAACDLSANDGDAPCQTATSVGTIAIGIGAGEQHRRLHGPDKIGVTRRRHSGRCCPESASQVCLY